MKAILLTAFLFTICLAKAFPPICGWNLTPGYLRFAPGSAHLSPEIKKCIDTLKLSMAANPSFKVVIAGTYGRSRLEHQLSWRRVTAIINYMSETMNIDRDRFIFSYSGMAASTNTIVYRRPQEGEEGPSYMPPPYPKDRR